MTRSVTAGRIRLLLLFLCCLGRADAQAAVIVDPFLEDFRIGDLGDPAQITLIDGWPAGLMTPLVIDPAWAQSAGQYFDRADLPRDDSLVTWRFLTPALGDAQASQTWYRIHQARVAALLSGDVPPDDVLANPTAEPFPSREILAATALRWADAGAYVRAAAAIRLLLRNGDALQLPVEEKFIWNLRALRLDELAGRPLPTTDHLWAYLLDLGPFDAASGWALWVAMRRDQGLLLVPSGAAERRLGVFLAARRSSWLTADDLAAAGFDSDIAAGLGAVALSRDELSHHFQLYGSPPRDGLFQGYWLRGKRRLAPGQAVAYEQLAQLPGLKDGHRLDTWRRASENRLLADQWDEGVDDLRAGLALMNSGASAAMKRKLRHWNEQALALASAQGRRASALEIWTLGLAEMHGEQADAFVREAGYWARRMDLPDAPAVPDTAAVKAAAAVRVESGGAGDLRGPGAMDLAEVSDRLAQRRWALWIQWGQGLAGASGSAGAIRYRTGLDAVAALPSGRSQYAAACALVGRLLHGTEFIEPLGEWTLGYDLARLSGEVSLPPRTPVPRLERQLRRRNRTDDLLLRHALLAICLATGDDRGTIAVAANLEATGLSVEQRLLFLYPVPTAGALRDALAAADLDVALLLATARNESLFDPAVRSRAGALGWLQIMPFHYKESARLAGPSHWSHATVSLEKATQLLHGGAQRYAADPYRALAAYNAGPKAVDRWDRQLGGNADRATFLALIGYAETRRYVEKVLIGREIYDWIMTEGATSPPPHRR